MIQIFFHSEYHEYEFIEILDNIGASVKSIFYEKIIGLNKLSVDISDLKSGKYFLSRKNGNGEKVVNMIIKQ